ncbi:putative haloacid dehalogenase-like hydrolase [Kitasatospora indigofera]|uniref:Haloacid dehalogenase-like hydrolase n=1 Tax=Kitasatospora indigofera TaxID=67307 RepID=A0A919GDT5_9ACTN|nr:phosphonatase-like hydrolase [Kitasatospora indigofera]GHH82685.1 putative haloacid dehalogenase-like hydrolase [Kitasatospora indigofera]
MSTDIRLVVLDMAGTTVADDGLVELAFRSAAAALGVEADSPEHRRMLEHVHATMGESKISVFRHLFGEEEKAQRANLAFEEAYHDLVGAGHCAAIPGAAEAIAELRGQGRKVVLTTGFSRATQDSILNALGWQSIADLTLCPAEAGRGRPYPDMVLTALLRTGTDSVRQIAVAGDTGYDMLTGTRSGAPVVAGVLTGAHGEERLRADGATHVLASITELPKLIAG